MSFPETPLPHIQTAERKQTDELKLFETNRRDKEIGLEYTTLTDGSPEMLLKKEMRAELRTMPSWKRALFIGGACNNLRVTPDALHEYFDDFPEDKALLTLFLEKEAGLGTSGFTHQIASVLAPELKDFEWFATHPLAWKYLAIASRRDQAPTHLITGFKQIYGDNFREFGKAAHGYFDAMEEAASIKNKRLEGTVHQEKIFSKEYQALSPEKRSSFLLKCLAELQFSMVFEEVYNSDSFYLGQYQHSILSTGITVTEEAYATPESKQMQWLQGSKQIEGINFYPHEYLALAVIKELGTLIDQAETIVPILVEFWKKNKNPLFTQSIAEVLSRLDPKKSSKELLTNLNDSNPTAKKALGAILFRIELGKIGISAQGVEYLGKLFDVGEYNQRNYSAQRLTPVGDIGIFDTEQQLLGYFNIGDPTTAEASVKTEVLRISKDLLFHTTGRETAEELAERETILSQFIAHYSEFFGSEWLTECNIRFNNLTFKEQGWFMHYTLRQQRSGVSETIAHTKKFFRTYGEIGVRAFLSLEQGMSGDAIVIIGSSFPEPLAETVFLKYNELTEQAETTSQYLNSTVREKEREHSQDISLALLIRAKEILVTASQRATTLKENSPEEQTRLAIEILTEIQTIKSDIELLKATFKTLREHNENISLEDFRDNSIVTQLGSELPRGEITRMRTLYTDSMQEYPEATKAELLADFDQHMHDEKSTFSLLRYKGEIAGFLCFTETKPGQKYVSAVTLDPRFQKAYIGEAMIDEAFAREAENNILGADCVAQKSVSARYIENGFIGVRSWDDKGDLIMDIVRDDRRNEKYFSTKSFSQEEIARLAPLGSIGTAQIEVVTNPREHAFALCNEGFVLTRYFKDKNTEKWYLVYEPKPTSVPENQGSEIREEALA